VIACGPGLIPPASPIDDAHYIPAVPDYKCRFAETIKSGVWKYRHGVITRKILVYQSVREA
jgi:hypothetical protein